MKKSFSNEYTNGLIRQYFRKSSDFTNITEKRVQEVDDKLNHRPRKTLGWMRMLNRESDLTSQEVLAMYTSRIDSVPVLVSTLLLKKSLDSHCLKVQGNSS